MKAKRLLYFILTALFVQNLWAQESTVKTLRIVYNTKYTDPIGIQESKDVQYLDIQGERSLIGKGNGIMCTKDCRPREN